MGTKCAHCGVDLSDFDVVCPACGTPQQVQANTTPSPSTPAAYDEAFPPVRPRSPHVGSLAMWLAIFAVLVIAGGVYKATLTVNAEVQPAQLSGDEAARMQQYQASHDACDEMETMVAQATQSQNAMDFKSALSAAEQGLQNQDGCKFDSKPAFAGILLSVKAVSEHFLSRGNAVADLEAANLQLEQCEAETSPADATNVRNCSNWLGNNRLYQQQWADQQ